MVKKSQDLSHLQKNLLTKSRTRERQTKSTWNNLFLKLITYICNKVHFFSGSNLWSSNLVSSFFWSSNLVGSFLWSSNLVIGQTDPRPDTYHEPNMANIIYSSSGTSQNLSCVNCKHNRPYYILVPFFISSSSTLIQA